MNILKLRYFVEVAKCGSFTEASRNLYTAQPNLSKQISQLEQELGFPLFIRSRKGAKLTPQGEYFYDQVKDIPNRIDQATNHGREMMRLQEEYLSIGVLEGQDINEELSRRLAAVKEVYPDIRISLERNSYGNLRSGLRSGHYDIIITLDFDVEKADDFQAFPLYRKSPAIAMHTTNPLSKKKDLSLEDLKKENFLAISKEESPGGFQRLIDSCKEAGFYPNIVRETRSLESLLLCLEMGLGVALLDQNTRLATSPYIVMFSQKDAVPMAVEAVVLKDVQDLNLLDVVHILSRKAAPEEDR